MISVRRTAMIAGLLPIAAGLVAPIPGSTDQALAQAQTRTCLVLAVKVQDLRNRLAQAKDGHERQDIQRQLSDDEDLQRRNLCVPPWQ